MKTQDISKLSQEDLNRKLAELQNQMVTLKLTHKMAPIENPMRIKSLRKTIARFNTEITKRNSAV
jgi:large subunit ribosomal protein L29